jgi:hypothetical protein
MKTALENIEKILREAWEKLDGETKEKLVDLAKILETEEGRKIVFTQIGMLYEKYAEQCHSFMSLVKPASETLAKNLSPLISTIIGIYSPFAAEIINAISNDQNLLRAYESSVKSKAGRRNKALLTYVEAGFTHAEAFALVMQDITKEN